MLSHYLKVGLRLLNRSRAHSVLSIAGLGLGLAAALLIFLYLRAERSYDAFHADADRLFRVTYEEIDTPAMRHVPTVSAPLGPTLAAEYPEVESFTRLRHADRHILRTGDQQHYEDRFLYADSTFFDLFSFAFAAGDPQAALRVPNGIVLTAATAERYFGDRPALGEMMQLDDRAPLVVTGVLAKPLGPSHLQFDFLLPFSQFRVPMGYPVTLESWGWISFPTYIRLAPEADPAALEAQLVGFMARHFDGRRAEQARLRLQPVRDIYLGQPTHTRYRHGNPALLSGLQAIAVLILLLAGFNFTNLMTVQALRRGKEVGVRKVLGAVRWQVRGQILGEVLLLALLSLLVAAGLAYEGLALLREHLALNLAVQAADVLAFGGAFLAATLVLGMLAGAYPAWLLARLPVMRAFRERITGRGQTASLRRVLVVLQFSIAAGLVFVSLAVFQQMEFLLGKDLGYDREQVVALHLPGDAPFEGFDVLKAQLLAQPEVAAVSRGDHLFDGIQGSVPIFAEGHGAEAVSAMNIYSIGVDYTETMGVAVVQGRALRPGEPTALLINEAAARYLAASVPGWDAPLGKHLRVDEITEGTVVGVIEDFHFASLHAEVAPLVLFQPEAAMQHILVRSQPGDAAALLGTLTATWAALFPDLPLDYTFLDAHVARLYQDEQRFLQLVAVFTLLALLIAGMGLYALMSFLCTLRLPEIAIRKVLGAEAWRVAWLLVRPFLAYLALANLIALPVAYLALQGWLGSYAYRVDLGWGLFAVATGATLVIGLGTIAYRTFQAAHTNPVTVLKAE